MRAPLLAIGLFLGAAAGTLAQPVDQQTTVLHLSQTAERSVLRATSCASISASRRPAPIL